MHTSELLHKRLLVLLLRAHRARRARVSLALRLLFSLAPAQLLLLPPRLLVHLTLQRLKLAAAAASATGAATRWARRPHGRTGIVLPATHAALDLQEWLCDLPQLLQLLLAQHLLESELLSGRQALPPFAQRLQSLGAPRKELLQPACLLLRCGLRTLLAEGLPAIRRPLSSQTLGEHGTSFAVVRRRRRRARSRRM